MVILLCGGGSGGHITPLLAVARALKRQAPALRLIYVGERQGRFGHLIKASPIFDKVYLIHAGKFRRYHNRPWREALGDLKTPLQNLRDFARAGQGFLESRQLLKKEKPAAAFIKGGFVGVPVGLACAAAGIPFITHDSDTTAGLANRLISRWAALHATGMPAELYNYPPAKTRFVGIPLSDNYKPVDTAEQQHFKTALGLPPDSRLLFITGGSLGARRLNKAVERIGGDLLRAYPHLYIIHQTGSESGDLYAGLDVSLTKRVRQYDFINHMHKYTGAADVVIARAGATTIAELAAQGRAVVVVPNPDLTGGHQLANANFLAKSQAAKVVTEAELKRGSAQLLNSVCQLLDSTALRQQLAASLHRLAQPAAAAVLANLILDVAKQGESES